MKTIALCQAYNEALFVERVLNHYINLVDGIIITEGALTPFGNLPKESPDGTRQIIKNWMNKSRHLNILFVDSYGPKIDFKKATDREGYEGINKNVMLEIAEKEFDLKNGDIIFILDCDEFFMPEAFAQHVELMKQHPEWNYIASEEWQFAYNTKLAFAASHGRFMRYKKGSKFGSTNHFKHPDGHDITRTIDYLMPRDQAGFFHMCWVKHPELIREKVISFNRPSFTAWFNYVYLIWPFNPNMAYQNNACIPPYHGTGFAEGQHTKLIENILEFPSVLKDLNIDWLEYIKKHKNELTIK